MIGDKYKNFITWDEKTGYTVWDESQAYEVGTTWYPKVAEAMMDAYAMYYLWGDENVIAALEEKV